MPKYSIDTSAILDAWIRYYPLDTFPSFWSHFKEFAKAEIGVASELIKRELKKKDDGCYNWFKENEIDHFFIEINDEVQNNVIELLKNPNFQRLIEDRKGINGADPFVIALAQAENLIVVTVEKPTNNPTRPKIPDVCIELDIQCFTILDLMRKEGWRF